MNKRLPILASELECTGCFACIDMCNFNALKSCRGEDGHLYVHLNETNCIGCLKCERVCLGRQAFVGDNNLKESLPFAAWSKDLDLRSRSTSGGVFAAIAYGVLKDGGAVVGAVFDGRHAKHILIETVEQLTQMQGSKYVQSNTEGIYQIIKKRLSQQKILFSGVGCQVAAVLSFFSNHPQKENLYTIDLICGGVPSDILMTKYFVSNSGLESITSFRTKRKYELRGILNGVEQSLEKKALPLAGFWSELTNRYSCYDCKYAFAHRKSNITIGDLWGEVGYNEEIERGISLVIVHNKVGQLLVDNASIEKHSIEWKKFLYHNARLVIGKSKVPFLRKRLSNNVKTMRDKLFVEAYTSQMTFSHPFLFCERCLRIIRQKIVRLCKIITIKNILEK